MIKYILYTPIDSDEYKISRISWAILLNWVCILIIIAFAFYLMINIDDKITIVQQPSNGSKIQILSTTQELNLSRSTPFLIFNNMKTMSFQIRQVNNVVRGSCLAGDQVIWNNTNVVSPNTDNKTYIQFYTTTKCFCKQEIFDCIFQYEFIVTAANNWRSITYPKKAFYINHLSTSLTSSDIDQNKIQFDAIGLQNTRELYTLQGTPLTISSHAIIIIFKDLFSSLIEDYQENVIGDVPTIIISNPTWSDKLVYFLATSFGLFGFLNIITRLLCYSKNDSEGNNVNNKIDFR